MLVFVELGAQAVKQAASARVRSRRLFFIKRKAEKGAERERNEAEYGGNRCSGSA